MSRVVAKVSSSSSSSSSKSFFSSFVSKNLSSFFPSSHLFDSSLLSRDSDFPTTTAKSPSSSRECRHGFCRWRARRVFFPSARSSSRERGSRLPSEDGDERKHPIERGKVPRRVPGEVHKNGIHSSGVSRDGGGVRDGVRRDVADGIQTF